MQALFLEYPKCSTCAKAKKFLEAHGVAFTDRHIVEQPPTVAELEAWIPKSGKTSKQFFNTSGMVYREMGLKDRLPDMPEAERLALLSSNGMLVKRPLLVLEDRVLIGFKEAEWTAALGE